jgi:hypothetical protein
LLLLTINGGNSYKGVGSTLFQGKVEVDIGLDHEINGLCALWMRLKEISKLILSGGCTDEEIKLVLDLHNLGAQSGILINKPA